MANYDNHLTFETALPFEKHCPLISPFDPPNDASECVSSVFHVFQMRKTGQKVKSFAQGYIAHKWLCMQVANKQHQF